MSCIRFDLPRSYSFITGFEKVSRKMIDQAKKLFIQNYLPHSGGGGSLRIFPSDFSRSDQKFLSRESGTDHRLDQVDVVETINLPIDRISLMLVTAGCNFPRADDPSQSVECTSEASASFEFDQAAFDVQHGVDTFPPADHYAIDLRTTLEARVVSLGS